jgi:hypothetical protein
VNSFLRLLKALSDNDVKFIVVGAFAAIAHGATQGTDDLDICYERTPANYRKIVRAIAGFGPKLRGVPENLKAPFDEHGLAQGTNFTLITDLGKLDLLGEMSGVGGYRQIAGTAKLIDLGGVSCRVASLDTIIKSKEEANRPKDQAALPELRALKMVKERERKKRDH